MLKGEGVSPGIAIAPILVLQSPIELSTLPRQHGGNADEECARFEQALATTGEIIIKQEEKARVNISDDIAGIFEAHYLMLFDHETVLDPIKTMISKDNYSAEYAIWSQFNNLAQVMLTLKNEYLRERADDFYSLRSQLLHALLGLTDNFKKPIVPTIIVADSASPSNIVYFDPKVIAGIVSERGNYNSHASILARTLEIPAVMGLTDILKDIDHGAVFALDGKSGTVWINPSEDTCEKLRSSSCDF